MGGEEDHCLEHDRQSSGCEICGGMGCKEDYCLEHGRQSSGWERWGRMGCKEDYTLKTSVNNLAILLTLMCET